jgi:hypothetical protein
MSSDVRALARAADSNSWFRAAARAGFAANGVVHATIGVIVLIATFGGDADADQTGALRSIAAAPLGFALLWILAAALWALGAWHALQAVLARKADKAKRLGRIASESGQALAFAVIAAIAAIVAAGAKPDAEEATEAASRGILSVAGGPILLGAIGLGVGVAGVAFIVMGLRRSFENKMALPAGVAGTIVAGIGLFGFVAKGASLCTIGVLLAIAAVRLEPETAGGLDGAVQALLRMPAGPLLGAAVGVGFLAYGVFCGFRAVFARLDA